VNSIRNLIPLPDAHRDEIQSADLLGQHARALHRPQISEPGGHSVLSCLRGDRRSQMFTKVESLSAIRRRYFLMQTAFAFAAAGALAAPRPAFANEDHGKAAGQAAANNDSRTAKTAQTAAALRDLWVDHIFWVRNVSVAAIENHAAAMKASEEQAVANAQSLAGSIEPFYGPGAKDSFFKLLAGHYGAVKAYLLATVDGNASAQATATQSLTSNAEEIAIFLSKANPHLSKDAVNGLLLAHGGHHIQQIQELKARNYASEAKTWESMKIHVYQIADATADALAKQFADQF
jgi:hypothetical protein